MARTAIDAVRDGLAHFDWETIRSEHGGRTATFRVFRDALRIEGVREVVSAHEAQQVADMLGAVLPTPRLLDLRYEQAAVRLPPLPKQYPGGVGMDSRRAIEEHSQRVDAEIGGRSGLVADVGKHWVLHEMVRKGRAVLYGWRVPYQQAGTWRGIRVYPTATKDSGFVIQQPSGAHDEHHRDYAMTLVLVDGTCEVDGESMATADVFRSKELCGLAVHDEKPLALVRVPTVPAPDEPVVRPPAGPEAPAPTPPAPVVVGATPKLVRGDRGPAVVRLQQLLVTSGLDLSPYGADGEFGATTDRAVRSFQRSRGLVVDGIVGRETWSALLDGGAVQPSVDSASPYPARPTFPPLPSTDARAAAFGHFAYVAAPTAANPEAIRITDGWVGANIVTVPVPQLAKIPGMVWRGQTVGAGPRSGTVACHRKIAKQLQALWQAWEATGLLPQVITWAGLWDPRFIRGSRSVLSNHAFGTAFDINAPWNALGATPAGPGQRGCLYDLVPLANQHGFYWGGHFTGRLDGMHFEVADVR